MHKLQGRLSQMQRLDALLLWRGNSDSQVLTGYLRPGRESHHSGTATGLPTKKRSLRSGYAAVGCANCSRRFNVFLPARQSSPDSIFTAQLPTHSTPASQAALLFLQPARHTLASALFPLSASFFQKDTSFTPLPPSGLDSIYVLVSQSCLTLCNPMHCSPPGSYVPGILQVGILEWVAISYTRGIFPTQGFQPRSPELQADSSPSEPPRKAFSKRLTQTTLFIITTLHAPYLVHKIYHLLTFYIIDFCYLCYLLGALFITCLPILKYKLLEGRKFCLFCLPYTFTHTHTK